jgi:hypothetical protein
VKTVSPHGSAIVVPSESDKRARTGGNPVHTWNRKLHYYFGLYLLLFLWLFSVSGLVINHPGWKIAQFFQARNETTATAAIQVPTASTDAALAANVMQQLAIEGEVTALQRTRSADTLTFQIVKPGQSYRIAADLASGEVSVTRIQLNAWGAADAMHKLTGVRIGDAGEQRDWIWTKLWSVAMDALALGLVVLIASGLYLWYRLDAKRTAGFIALGLGIACCAFFVFG